MPSIVAVRLRCLDRETNAVKVPETKAGRFAARPGSSADSPNHRPRAALRSSVQLRQNEFERTIVVGSSPTFQQVRSLRIGAEGGN
jgi:hypothetical protein